MNRPRTVILCLNGMVAVFDLDGKQIPDLQGRFTFVAEGLLGACDENTVFSAGPHRGVSLSVFVRAGRFFDALESKGPPRGAEEE